MKPTLIQRLKARLLVSGHKKQQGVAILTVLAIITLMTVLVISFFNMAQSAQSTAKGSVEIQRVTTLKDTIINLVIAQFREASRLTPVNPGRPREIITWTSQPGAIRTYSSTDSSQNKIFKLYSSNVPQLTDVAVGNTSRVLDQINDDLVPDWAERPDEFTDINRPVYTAATGDRAQATGANKVGYSYPIVDPRAWNGQEKDIDQNTEGFTYSEKSRGKTIRGVDERQAQLAMPLRWIYTLQDGTLGFLSDSREFTSLSGGSGSEVSKENPIVGRMAWWADDESCKINVNTASVPAIWDTPRTTSKEDVWLAKTQPLAGEYQRYPGHPATVDLCAVLFPGCRYASTDGSFAMSPGESMRRALTDDEANLIWDLAPFIVGKSTRSSSGSTGTIGGTVKTPSNGTTVGFENDDHLFTSLDEVYFKASGATNPSMNNPRDSLESLGKDPRGTFLQRLERAQFFLTHKSHSPELTNQGFPRVSMFPMDTLATNYLTNQSLAINATSGVSPYDITMAVNSTIGGRPYYLQRRTPTSRHNEFYTTEGATDPQRDVKLFGYLKELSRLPIAGYPPGYAGSQPFKVPNLTEDPDGTSLASKYPSGYNPISRTRYVDNKVDIVNQQTRGDASDRTQILLNMLDYTRSLNMQPVFVNQAQRYDDGNGQATAICACGLVGAGNHTQSIAYTNTTMRTPKGAGKLLAPAEIAMVINVAAKKVGKDAGSKEWAGLVALMAANSKSTEVAKDDDGAGVRYIVEVGFVMSGFNPKLGWAPVMPNGGIAISTPVTGDPSSPAGAEGTTTTAQNDVLPLFCALDTSRTERLRLCGASNRWASSGGSSAGDGVTRKTAQGLIPYGGMQGPRAVMGTVGEPNNNNFAICSPLCIRVNEENDGAVQVPLQVDPSGVVRIMTMDGPADPSNVTSAVDIKLPQNFTTGLTLKYTGISLRNMAKTYTMNGNATQAFPDPNCITRSLVLPHGDYRLTTALRMDNDLFVAHSGYTGKMVHSFYESNEKPAFRQMKGGTYSPMTLIDKKAVPKYIGPGSSNNMTSLPFPLVDAKDMALKTASIDTMSTTYVSSTVNKTEDPDVVKFASGSKDSQRAPIFAFGRRDGQNMLPKRGSSDPDETGDFDNGLGSAEDGPYMNYPDEGDRRGNGSGTTIPYFTGLTKPLATTDGKPAQNISPNFLVRSPVDFGSIPSGMQARVPWQTLRFRPDPGMNDPNKTMTSLSQSPPKYLPFANFCGPRDHFFLDLFWMPVVEPYSISEPFSTKGTINLNQQIFPFMYINRTTALWALFRGERMLAIPNDAADKYKKVAADGRPDNEDDSYRYFVNPKETVSQFLTRYNTGKDPEGFDLAFNTFRSASEICEVWLVPDRNGSKYDTGPLWDLSYTIGKADNSGREGFWEQHRLTGDNSRERPYANLYPRVTVRSNVFKLHMVAQTLQKARSTDVKTFDSVTDLVTAEWRGSCLIERSADSTDAALRNIDYTNLNAQTISPTAVPRIDRFYTYRVTEVKQLTQ